MRNKKLCTILSPDGRKACGNPVVAHVNPAYDGGCVCIKHLRICIANGVYAERIIDRDAVERIYSWEEMVL